MATFTTYAEVLKPDHPLMKNYARATKARPSRYRPAEIEQAMRAEPGVVLGDVLRRTGGVYETTTRLTPKSREDIREIAELTSDDELLRVSELPEVPVSLEHLRQVDPQTLIHLASEQENRPNMTRPIATGTRSHGPSGLASRACPRRSASNGRAVRSSSPAITTVGDGQAVTGKR